MDTLSLIIGVAGGLLAGVIAALKIIAPQTKTTVDDTALSYAEKLEALVAELQSAGVIKTPAPAILK